MVKRVALKHGTVTERCRATPLHHPKNAAAVPPVASSPKLPVMGMGLRILVLMAPSSAERDHCAIRHLIAQNCPSYNSW
jgi:hypothetical protein